MEDPVSPSPTRNTMRATALRDFMAVVEGPMPPAVTAGKMRSPTLRDVLAVLFRHRGLIILSFLTILSGVLLVIFTMPKQYESHMKILVKRERMDMVMTPESSGQTYTSRDVTQEDINSEVELLKSRDLFEKVVVACGLQKPQGGSSFWKMIQDRLGRKDSKPLNESLLIPLAVRSLETNMVVEPIAKSEIIQVSYSAPDPQQAARVLEALATFYLEKHLAVHRPPGALDFFQQQAERYRKEMASAEQQLAEFGQKEGVVSVEIEKDITLHTLSDFEAKLRENQAAGASVAQRIKSLEAQVRATPERVTTLVRTAQDPLVLQQMRTTLLNLQLRRTELLTKYDPGYRTVQEVDAQIAQAQQALADAEKKTVRDETTDLDKTHAWLEEELARARAELATLKARSIDLARSVESYRDSARQINRREIEHQNLARVAKTAEDNYLLYLRKQEEARISDALDRKRIVNVALAEAATAPAFPSSRNRALYLALGVALACLTSLGLAFGADYLDPSFRTPDEVEGYLCVPVLASIPKT